MASHTLAFPAIKSTLSQTASFRLLCVIGNAAGLILALPFLAVGCAFTFSFLVLDAVFARNHKQRQW